MGAGMYVSLLPVWQVPHIAIISCSLKLSSLSRSFTDRMTVNPCGAIVGNLNRRKSNFQYVCDRLKHFYSLRMCDISPKQTNIDLFIYSFIQRMPLLANSTSNYRRDGSSLMEITAASTGPPSLFSILDRMQISIARIIQRYLAKERK